MRFFDSPRCLDSITYDLVLSEFPRGQNRARIQNLANGSAPYTTEEAEENNITVNVSDLSHPRLLHDARANFSQAFERTGNFARASTDAGVVHRRTDRSSIVTRNWNQIMKGSVRYFETRRAKIGNLVLHGIGSGVWENEDCWCLKPLGVEDVLLPGETLLGFDNLPFLILRRSFTAVELYKLTMAAKRDPGWNMPFVDRIKEWLNEQATQLRALNWPDVWAPEKIAERAKEESGGFLAGDRAPRMDVFDIYVYDDSDGEEGWVRRIILDSWSEPAVPSGNGEWSATRKDGVAGDTGEFLFTSGDRKVGQTWQNIVSFQFADLSAVFPARYHSVRGLGWMLYAACHLGNRMRCKFYESVFEALNMLFEVNSAEDAQNALKLNLVSRGFIDKTIRPVKAQDRWQVNANLVELGLQDNAGVISQNASAWTQNPQRAQDKTEKTRFQVMAEMQASQALVSAAVGQAYQYQGFEYREIFRRFCRLNSTDADVRRFQAKCLKEGVPEKYLHDPDCWNIESEQMMGAGNKTLAMTIAQQLMQWRPMLDPEPQRKVLRDSILAVSDDAALAIDLVPEQPAKVTSSVHDAELTAGALMQGIPVEPLTGINHIETIGTLLKILESRIQQGLKSGGMLPPNVLQGLMAIQQHIAQHLKILAQDKQEQAVVKEFANRLKNAANQLRAFGQRLQKQMQAQAKAQQGNGAGGGVDPKDQAKIAATQALGKVKIDLAKQSHAAKTAQRSVQFQRQLQQDSQKHQADLAKTDLEAASNIRRNRLTSLNEE